MKTASEIEIELGLAAGSVTVHTDDAGRSAVMVAGERIETSCSLWSLRCICTRRGFDAAIETGMASLEVNPQGVARAMWQFYSQPLTRSDWLIKQLRVWIGYNDRRMDALFAAAVELEAAR